MARTFRAYAPHHVAAQVAYAAEGAPATAYRKRVAGGRDGAHVPVLREPGAGPAEVWTPGAKAFAKRRARRAERRAARV